MSGKWSRLSELITLGWDGDSGEAKNDEMYTREAKEASYDVVNCVIKDLTLVNAVSCIGWHKRTHALI